MSLAIKAAQARGSTLRPSAATTRVMGDPGLFGFLGKVGKAAIGGVTGLLTGGPGAAIQGAVSPFVSRPSAPPQRQLMAPPPSAGPGMNGGQVIRRPTPGFAGAVQRAVPGGATGFEAVGCPPGFHANKSDYFLRDGTFVAKGTKCVKNRRRNAMNPRALRRAVSRVEMGKRWQSKLSEISTGRYTASGKRKNRKC